ncbi:MAG: histidine phosphatase family protein [Candidatus Xenobia bacterium]
METRILLIRHAEPNNPQRIVYGRLPGVGLTERGRAQASAVGAQLAAFRPRHLYSSPLLRARQTARIVARPYQARLHTATGLLEVRTSYQGGPLGAAGPASNYYEPSLNPGDESLQDLVDRMTRTLSAVARRHPGEQVFAVSHGDPIAAFRIHARGRPLTVQELRGADYPQLASVTELIYRKGQLADMQYFPLALQ